MVFSGRPGAGSAVPVDQYSSLFGSGLSAEHVFHRSKRARAIPAVAQNVRRVERLQIGMFFRVSHDHVTRR